MNEYERILQEADADRRRQAEADEQAKQELKQAVKEALAEESRKPTKESIMAEPNRAKRQRLIKEHLDLFQ